MAASIIGIDVGGTKIAAARFDDRFSVLARTRRPTPPEATRLAAEVVAAARAVWDPDVIAVGAGVAGLVRWPEGVTVWVPHVRGPAVDLRAHLGEELAVPAVVDNDANAAALAEFELGAGRGYGSGLLVTVGTGIGGGMVHRGEIYRGRSFAGEIGHMTVEPDGFACPCGRRGCWETRASGAALARLAAAEVAGHPDGEVARQAAGAVPAGEHVVAAAGAGDGAALALLDEVARWFGRGLAGLIAALDPEAIVVGGGLGSAGEPFLGPARDEVRAGLYGGQHRPATPILPAAFGSEGGLVGAALAAWREASLRFRFREAGRRVIGTRARGLPPGRERRSGR